MKAPIGERAGGVALLACSFLGGCLQLGPRSVRRDQFDYSTAVADAWKDQMLLNIVKLRYADVPVFVDVAQIVSGYSLETTVDAGGSLGSGSGDNILSLGAGSTFTDRPTLTYTPKTGNQFLKALMVPIDPTALFLLVQSGYNARFIFEWALESVNGVRNRSAVAGAVREPDPDFERLMDMISKAQFAGAFGVRVEQDEARKESTVIFFRRENLGPEAQAFVDEAKGIMGFAPDRDRFLVVFSPVRGGSDELSVQTRSILQVLIAMGMFIEAPEEHVASGRALPGASGAGPASWPLRIHSGKDEPADAFAAIRYDQHWFWIDHDDLVSKRAFFLVTFLFALSETGGGQGAPVLTIPTG